MEKDKAEIEREIAFILEKYSKDMSTDHWSSISMGIPEDSFSDVTEDIVQLINEINHQ